MRLSDVVGAADLAIFAEIGLVLFGCAFVGVLVYTFTRRNRETFARARLLPLDDDGPGRAPVANEPTDAPAAEPERIR